LRNALLELLKSESFEQITIRDIAATAGIGYTTFFRHHPSKDSLLDEIAAEEMRRLLDILLSAFENADTRASSIALCAYISAHRTLWSSLLTGGATSTLRDEFVRIARKVADNTPHTAEWLPAEVGINLVASSTIELLAWWLRQENPSTVEQTALIYERYVLAPIFQSHDD
jgi:AcrR family transcriptional regulator